MPFTFRLPPAGTKPFDIVAFGENSLDFLGVSPGSPTPRADKSPLSSFEILPGGQAATFAIGCARQGCRSRYVGCFGTDVTGRTVRTALTAETVDVVALEREDARSRTAIILVDGGGDRHVYEFRDPALAVEPDTLPVEALLSGRLLMIDATMGPASIAAARAARAAGVRTLVDIDTACDGYRDLLSEVDVIIVPESFLGEVSPGTDASAALRHMAQAFEPDLVIATMRDAGSLALSGGQTTATPGYRDVDIVDTTGAGDAFRAGFASALVRLGEEASLNQVLEHANATAALNCRAAGAQRGLPTWAEVEALVTRAGRGRSN